mmetsp:Transcript_18948/g.59527  ORF Transcript_18948/g.59527 Transcript_18948/m.59527 type:complete len:252 (+) Transcript_18948:667-1422(+)
MRSIRWSLTRFLQSVRVMAVRSEPSSSSTTATEEVWLSTMAWSASRTGRSPETRTGVLSASPEAATVEARRSAWSCRSLRRSEKESIPRNSPAPSTTQSLWSRFSRRTETASAAESVDLIAVIGLRFERSETRRTGDAVESPSSRTLSSSFVGLLRIPRSRSSARSAKSNIPTNAPDDVLIGADEIPCFARIPAARAAFISASITTGTCCVRDRIEPTSTANTDSSSGGNAFISLSRRTAWTSPGAAVAKT